jgi:HrpA-like RNA helicase
MTDGILVQKIYQDPLLEEFSIIILDDIHERSINYEILFGFLKIIMNKRADLKLIITSATLEDNSIKTFFEKKKL